MGNSLVEAKKAGEKNLEVLLAGEMSDAEKSRLDEITDEVSGLQTSAIDGLVQVSIKQGELINEAYDIFKDEMTFAAWWDKKVIAEALPFKLTKARQLRYLAVFCKNKGNGVRHMNLKMLTELSKAKWAETVIEGSKVKYHQEKRKAVTVAYDRLRQLAPAEQTASNAKSYIEKSLEEAGQPLPPTKTPPLLKLGQAEDKIDRLFQQLYMRFRGLDELKYLKKHIEGEIQNW